MKKSDAENFMDFCKAVAGDGDAAVDGRIELEIITAGAARGEGAHTI